MSIQVLMLLAFVAVTAAIVGVSMLMAGRWQAAREKTIEDRLQEASGIVVDPAQPPKESLVREHKADPSKADRWLKQAGVTMSLSACVITSLLLAAGGAAVVLTLSRRAWAMPIGFLIGLSIQPALLRYRRTKRMNKFEEHFPEALDLLSRAVRAGHAFSAGMKMVADEVDDPVGPEFRTAFDEQNFGLPLKESLNNLSDRIPLLDVRFFCTAVLIQRETGGNLAEILDNLANVVRERFKIRRQVRVHTAHGRFTGYVLMALPAFLAIALSFINPEHMALLFEERMGQLMILASIAMQATGFFWIKQIVKIEV